LKFSLTYRNTSTCNIAGGECKNTKWSHSRSVLSKVGAKMRKDPALDLMLETNDQTGEGYNDIMIGWELGISRI
jgi:hypothetical protein